MSDEDRQMVTLCVVTLSPSSKMSSLTHQRVHGATIPPGTNRLLYVCYGRIPELPGSPNICQEGKVFISNAGVPEQTCWARARAIATKCSRIDITHFSKKISTTRAKRTIFLCEALFDQNYRFHWNPGHHAAWPGQSPNTLVASSFSSLMAVSRPVIFFQPPVKGVCGTLDS